MSEGDDVRKIAVIGATGMLGQPVTRALVAAGFEVTALVRNVTAARRTVPPEVALVHADASDEASLRRGLAGQDALYLSLSIQPRERKRDFHTEAQGLDHIINAARVAGIKRIGYLSALVIDSEDGKWWVLDVWRSAVARLKASGIPTTVFYASNVMETLPQRHKMGRALVLAGASHHPNYWIAGRDLGAQVARAFQLAAKRRAATMSARPRARHVRGGGAALCARQRREDARRHAAAHAAAARRAVLHLDALQRAHPAHGAALPRRVQSRRHLARSGRAHHHH